MRAFLEKIGSDCKIENRTLAVELKKPWNYLHELAKQNPAEGRAIGEIGETLQMWCLLEKVCIYFQENPE
jgi:hypothetical protein